MHDDPHLSLDQTLPEMTGEQALTVVRILQLIADAIWRIHGDEMCRIVARDVPVPDLDRDDRLNLPAE